MHQVDKNLRFAEKLSVVLLSISLLVGLIFRLRMYLMNRSLWLDTANLANNLIENGYLALWGPLQNNQSAPIAFLFASKFIGSVFDYSELALTFLPMIFGIGALVLFLFLCLHVVGRVVAPLAFIPFTFCSTAIIYSGEFKQYTTELFFSVLILFVSYRILTKNYEQKWIIAFGVTGIISVWFSLTAIFMIAGTGLAVFLSAIREGNRRNIQFIRITGEIILLHFLALYFLQIRPSMPEFMFAYWSSYFAPILPISSDTLSWWYTTILGYAKYPLGFQGYGVWVSLAALLFGFVTLFANKPSRPIANLFFYPLLLLVLLSIFHLYPIATGTSEMYSRLVLFTVPITYIVIAIGISEFSKLFSKPLLVTAALGGLLMFSTINNMIPWPFYYTEDMRPLVSSLNEEHSQEDSVYVYVRSIPAFTFYTRSKPVQFYRGTTTKPEDLPKDLERVFEGGSKRIWAVASHEYTETLMIIKRELEYRNGPVRTYQFPGALLFLSEPPANGN